MSESNIPIHNHGTNGSVYPLHDKTSFEVANITNATHNHIHYFNASHYHTINDPGHYHFLAFDTENAYTLNRSLGGNTYNALQTTTTSDYVPLYAARNATGISVNEEQISKFTDGPLNPSDPSQVENNVTITQGGHAHSLASYGVADANRVAIVTTPVYQAVYTWYRDS